MTKKNARASRREFIKRAGYVPPAILTLAVAPSFAKAGSGKPAEKGLGKPAEKGPEKSAGNVPQNKKQ